MALFDSVISGASEKFGLGDKAGTMLSALLALMTNQETGGFSGFLDRFRDAGLGDTATSWVTSGDNAEISDEQIESAIGEETIGTIAEQVGVSKDKTTSALAFMTPKIVDNLTPDGEVPDDDSLLATIGGFLTGIGGAAAGAVGTAGAMASDAAGSVGDAAEAVGDKIGDAFDSVGGGFDSDGDGDGGNILKWLLPLLLLGILLVLGFMFCDNGNKGAKTDGDHGEKTEKTKTDETKKEDGTDQVDSSVSLVAKDGKYSITGVVENEETKNKILKEAEATFGEGNVDVSGLKVDAKAKPLKDGWFDGFKGLLPDLKDWKDGTLTWTGNAITTVGEIPGAVGDKIKSLFGGWTYGSSDNEAKNAGDGDGEKELAKITLSGDTELDAYPGGIEEQLITFIKSDEYKNATDEDLKKKWFDFDDLNFVFGKTELVPASQRQLDNIVAILKEYPEVKIKIGGYTDKTGNDAANKALSDKRAKAVKAALDKAGVGSQVPEAEGYGEEQAKVDESASDKEREADRKTSVRLIKSEEKPAEDAEKKE